MAVFGPMIARRLRAMRPKPHTTWHLDEMFVSIGGKRIYLWRAVDAEGEVLDCLVQPRVNAGRRCSHPLRASGSMVRPGCVGYPPVPALPNFRACPKRAVSFRQRLEGTVR